VVSTDSYSIFFGVKAVHEVYLFYLDCLTLKMETLLHVETSGTTHLTKRRGVPDGVTIGPFEKSELQGNVWQDIVMKAISRQEKDK
jgi:hypothetical protein